MSRVWAHLAESAYWDILVEEGRTRHDFATNLELEDRRKAMNAMVGWSVNSVSCERTVARARCHSIDFNRIKES